jgi:SAM-dependent methyltransferase
MDVMVKSGGRRIGLFAAMKPGRLLDVPAGAGRQARALGELGYQVVTADLAPAGPAREKIMAVNADANVPLPFRSASFDYILSREGIEHLENQTGFIAECARLLRPGGTIVLTTPNVMHLSARISVLLTGQRNLKRGLVNEVESLRSANGPHRYHGHVFLIDYFRLRYLMRLAGFDGLRVYTDRYSGTAIALAWIVPLMYVASRYALAISSRRRSGKYPVASRPLANEIMHHVFSPAMLFGKRMIVVAEKIGGGQSQ